MLSSTLIPIAALACTASAKYTFDPLKHLTGIAPYFTPEDPATDPAPPQGCNVTRAVFAVRHAAIYANDFDFEEYIEPFVMKLLNTTVDWSKTQDLDFLTTWKSPIEEEDVSDLSKFGQLEAFQLGVEMKQRYLEGDFKDPKKVWTASAERTTKSAKSFIEGMVKQSNETELVSVSEGEEEGANSLTPHDTCPGYSGARGSDESLVFKKIYTKPIIARLHAQAPAFNFTTNDIVGMQQLCGYETVIRGESPFCSTDLFTPDDWLSFEYANDIMYHYSVGYGNATVSGAQGFPFANATANLLLSNSTDDQDLYVSFVHRELPPVLLVALGLFNNSAFSSSNDINATMPNTRINHRRTWKASHILPFLTNVGIERMSCDSYGYDAGEYVRVLVNEAPQPLPTCIDGPGESCTMDAFQSFIKERGELFGDFSTLCGVEYKNSTNTLSIFNSGPA